MIGLDTNVLVRFVTQDDEAQARAVDRFFADHAGERFHVSLPVVVELSWVLASVYRYERAQVAAVLEALLETRQLALQAPDDVRRALSAYRAGGAGFADHLIGQLHLSAGCQHTVTFDGKLAKAPGFALLRAR